jgi:5-dehydro-2-deoxygluconokinase
VLKRGGEGAVLFEDEHLLEVSPVKMEVVNGLGAGDAFLAGLTHGVLRGMELGAAVRRANWAGAYVASQIPCSEAMPYLKHLEAAVT